MSSAFFKKNPVLSWALIAGALVLVAGGAYFAIEKREPPASQVSADSGEAARRRRLIGPQDGRWTPIRRCDS